VIINRDG